MNKEQFISAVRARLAYLPESETEKFIAFYAESIDDRVEDGMDEREAVAAMGGVDEAVRAIESEMPLSTLVRQRVRYSREQHERAWDAGDARASGARSSGGGHSGAWIALAIIGSPVWLTLLCVLAALVITVYAAAFAMAAAMFAVLLSLGVSALALGVYGVTRLAAEGVAAAALCLGMALIFAGLTVMLARPCAWLAKQLVKLPVLFWRWLKGMFISRGRNDW